MALGRIVLSSKDKRSSKAKKYALNISGDGKRGTDFVIGLCSFNTLPIYTDTLKVRISNNNSLFAPSLRGSEKFRLHGLINRKVGTVGFVGLCASAIGKCPTNIPVSIFAMRFRLYKLIPNVLGYFGVFIDSPTMKLNIHLSGMRVVSCRCNV